jgi:hypothetical protein
MYNSARICKVCVARRKAGANTTGGATMRFGFRGITWGAVLILAGLPTLTRAQSLPAVNLGLTSFLDGGAPAGPGLYFQEYLHFWTSSDLKDQQGNSTPFLNNLNAWASINQLIYQSPFTLPTGGKFGLDFVLPVLYIDVNPGNPPVLSSNYGGLGDMLVGPFIQWDPIMGKNGPIFMHRIELENLVPTGKYDPDKILNPGSNFYSFNPYWAGTVFMSPKWEASWRLHYLWNDKNTQPNTTLFPGAQDTQAGQAVHLNFASSYEVLPHCRGGLNGYYLKQFTNAEVDGNGVPNSREQVLGLGPGAMYSFSQDNHLFFNAYFETAAENRPQGMRFTARWTHHF